MNARDRVYTGKVSEWGLPDGTVVVNNYGEEISIKQEYCLCWRYKIKTLPDGYEFDNHGRIVKVEPKKGYWNGKDQLEVGMIVGKKSSQKEHEVLKQNKRAVALLELQSGHLSWCNKRDLAQIDTRTDKDKAVDFIVSIGVNKEFALSVVDRIIDGKIHGVKWVGKDD